MVIVTTFEELREYILDEKRWLLELLSEQLEEISPFQLGRCQGKILALNNILEVLRNSMKHGDME